MITRRTFVGALGATTAAGALGVGLFEVSRRRLSPGEIRPDVVTPLNGSTVVLRAPDGRRLWAVVEDVEVRRRPARPGAPGTEQISVLFAADGEAGFYRVDHADVSLGKLYLSPVGMPGRDRRLEAVITRIV